MALREELERQGTWLFRWRSYLPLVMVAVVMTGMARFDYPNHDRARQDLWEAVGLAVSGLGLVVRALVIGFVPRGTSGRNTGAGQVADVLNTSGMYALVRHPLYLGNFLMWLGMALVPRSPSLAVIVCLAFWLYYERIMFAEEEFLRRKFVGDYETWAVRTPAFWPRRLRWDASERPVEAFSVRNVLKREYSGLLAVGAIFALLDLEGSVVAQGRIALDVLGRTVLLSTLTVYLVLLVLKRKTRLLHVEGR